MRLLDQVRHVIRKKHYSIRTEQAYTDWIKRFILFHGKRHPKDMGKKKFPSIYRTLRSREMSLQAPRTRHSMLMFCFINIWFNSGDSR